MDKTIELVERLRDSGNLFDEKNKIRQSAIDELGKVGYWGLLVDPKYGGSGAPFAAFARFLTKMATIDPTVAGLASVHGCIGAVDPLRDLRQLRAESSATCPSWPAASGSRASP